MSNLRKYKKPFKILRKWKDKVGVRHVECEADFFISTSDYSDGPGDDLGDWGYKTKRFTVSSKFYRSKVSPSVSYWPELKRALEV